jgi:hypothetical protein
MPNLRTINFEKIENGTVVSYCFEGEYDTKKQFFNSDVEARQWAMGEITKEIEHINPNQIAYRELPADEIPF